MKVVHSTVFFFIAIFGMTATAQVAPPETTYVVEYLQKGFGFAYSPVNDGMKCSDSISTPQQRLFIDLGKKVYPNCVAESTEGYTVMIGWIAIKSEAAKAGERFNFQKDFAGLQIRKRMKANPSEKLIASNPFNCTVLTKETKGDLVECSMVPLKSDDREIPFNFYVFYFSPSSDSKEIFLLASDDFKKQPIKEILFEYVSRIR